MKKETWKTIIQIVISILTAALTAMGTTSCMNAMMSLPKFPEGYSSSGSNVKGIDAVVHGNADDIIGLGNGEVRQTIALCAHDDGQTGLCFQLRVVEGNAIVSKCHSSSTEPDVVQRGRWTIKPRPRDEEYGAHGYTDGSAVQRVT